MNYAARAALTAVVFVLALLAADPASPLSLKKRNQGAPSPHYEAVTTTDATQTVLVQLNLPEDGVQHVRARVLARNTSTGAAKGWEILFLAKRVGSGNAQMVGAPIITFLQGDALMATATVVGDCDSDQARINIIGIAATTIDWYGEYLGLQCWP